jgi:cell shape-determining protein MreC
VTFENARKLGLFVGMMFLVLSFWNNPSAAAGTFTDFVGDVGGFFSAVIDKCAEFVRGLAG